MHSQGLITIKNPGSYISERYKMLRTNLDVINSGSKSTLLITSSSSEEGRTITASNLAVTMAQTGKKVLLVEANLRNPLIHDLFGIAKAPGLTELLTNNKQINELVKEDPSCKGLHILTSGELSASPSELLNASAFEVFLDQAKEIYDSIIIDAPPVTHFTDAAIISRRVDGVLLTAVCNKTNKASIANAQKALSQVGANILGVVMIKPTKK